MPQDNWWEQYEKVGQPAQGNSPPAFIPGVPKPKAPPPRDDLSIRQAELDIEAKTLDNQAKREKVTGEGVTYSQASIDAFDRGLKSIKRMRSHPGKAAAVGSGFDPAAIGSYNPFTGQAFGGTNAAGFEARLEAFKAQTFLPMVQALKGMGALSNAEGDRLVASIGAVDPKMPEADFDASLNEIEQELLLYRDRGAKGAEPNAKSSTINPIAHGEQILRQKLTELKPDWIAKFKAKRPNGNAEAAWANVEKAARTRFENSPSVKRIKGRGETSGGWGKVEVSD